VLSSLKELLQALLLWCMPTVAINRLNESEGRIEVSKYHLRTMVKTGNAMFLLGMALTYSKVKRFIGARRLKTLNTCGIRS